MPPRRRYSHRASPACPCAECAGEAMTKYAARRIRIHGPADAWPLVSFIASRKQEHLVCVSLNAAYEPIAVRVVTVGTVNANLVHPREVFADPIVDRATAIILAHNHPSGSVDISPEDLAVTKRIKEAGRILGIRLLDHLIVADPNRWRSLIRNEK